MNTKPIYWSEGQSDSKETLLRHTLTWVQVSLLPGNKNISDHIDIKAFDLVFVDDQGNERSVDYTFLLWYPKNQDVIDCLMTFQKNGEWRIVVNKSIRPIITARPLLTWDEKPYTESGLFTELPAVIFNDMKGDISPKETMLRGIMEKNHIDASQIIKSQLVGWGLYSSIGGDCEMYKLFHVQLYHSTMFDSDYTVHGKDFGGNRVVSSMTPQEIVNGFFGGELFDMRLLYATLQFAHTAWISLAIPLSLNAHRLTRYNIDWKIVTKHNVKQILQAYKTDNNIKDIRLEPVGAPLTDEGFVRQVSMEVINTYDDGAAESYKAEGLVRRIPDSIDVGGYFFSDGRLYMACRLAIRPGILARNFKPHPIATSLNPVHIEWLGGIANRSVEDIIRSESWCGTWSSTQVLSYFPSIGHSPEVVHTYMAELDLSNQTEIDRELEIVDSMLYYIELDELIGMWQQGMIDDPRILIQAYLLKSIFNYTSIDNQIITDIDRENLNNILMSSSQMDRYMKETDIRYPEDKIFEKHIRWKNVSPWYRKVISYGEDILGTVFVWPWMLKGDRISEFFAGMLPIFPVPWEDLRKKYAGYAIHDGGHHIQGDILPFDPQSGKWIPKEQYVRLMSKTESLAVFDSDYRYPMELGLEESEEQIGGNKSIARSFNELGITDPHEVCEIIVSIETDGIIPDKILKHPKYEDNRANIVDRLLRFHFMDKIQAEVMYDRWLQNEEVIKAALRFCNTTADPHDFEHKMDCYDEIVAQFPEWSNPLKAYIARIVTKDIGLLGLRYGVLNQMLVDSYGSEHQVLRRTYKIMDELEFYKIQLHMIRDRVADPNLSDENIMVMKQAEHWKAKVVLLEREFYNILKQQDLLSHEQVVRLTTDDIPYFQWFAQMPDLKELIEEKERENVNRLKG